MLFFLVKSISLESFLKYLELFLLLDNSFKVGCICSGGKKGNLEERILEFLFMWGLSFIY